MPAERRYRLPEFDTNIMIRARYAKAGTIMDSISLDERYCAKLVATNTTEPAVHITDANKRTPTTPRLPMVVAILPTIAKYWYKKRSK